MNSRRKTSVEPASEESLRVLREALAHAVERAGKAPQELSKELDRHPTYVHRLLRGETLLRVEEVFHLLAVLDETPVKFLGEAFPLGGLEERAVRMQEGWTGESTSLGGLSTRRLMAGARLEMEQTAPSSVALALRAGQHLRRLIQRRGRTQKELAEQLGKSARSLGNALSGRSELTFELVFQVLDLLDVSAGRYFLEVLVEHENPLDRLDWHRMLDFAEDRRRRMAAALADEHEALPDETPEDSPS